MIAIENIVRHCPKCGSIRVRRSRRRGVYERVLTGFGASVCRCHDCCGRQAWFGVTPMRLGGKDPDSSAWTGFALLGGVLVTCILLVYWFVTRFSGLSG